MGETIGIAVDWVSGVTWRVTQVAWWLVDLIPFGPAAVMTVASATFAALVMYVALARLQDLWQRDALTTFWKVIALIAAVIFYPIDAFLAVVAGIFVYQSFPRWHEKEFLLTALTQRMLDTETGHRFRAAAFLGRQLNVIDANHVTFPTATEKVARLGED